MLRLSCLCRPPLAIILALLSGPSIGVPPDSSLFQPIAVLPFRPSVDVTCGDADHNGRHEVYLFRDRTTFALEHAGGDKFDTFPMPLPLDGIAWDIGDTDRDGQTDLVFQFNPEAFGQTASVYEGPDSTSLPDSLVWADTVMEMGRYMYARITDFDADSSLELAYRDEIDRAIVLAENRGDNQYSVVTRIHPPAPHDHPLMFCVSFDLDRDGRPEMAIGTDTGWLMLYEPMPGDSYLNVLSCSLHVRSGQARCIEAGPDIDRDGRAEVFALFVGVSNVGVFAMFESPSDDSFEIAWRSDIAANYWGYQSLAFGDIDGDGVLEFALATGFATGVYRCVGNDSFEMLWSDPGYYRPITLYDINQDGRDELIARSGTDETTILEYLPVGLAERAAARLRAVEVSPSVLRPGAALHLSGLPPGARVELHDISGRVCLSSDLSFVLGTSSLRPGVYLVRITSGSQSITRKVLVVE